MRRCCLARARPSVLPSVHPPPVRVGQSQVGVEWAVGNAGTGGGGEESATATLLHWVNNGENGRVEGEGAGEHRLRLRVVAIQT